MATWHIGDIHFSHPNCNIKWRGFGSTDEHNSYIVDRCAALIAPGDEVINHGDTGMRSLTARLELLAQIPGEQTLLMGNHDEIHPCNPRAKPSSARRRDRWAGVFGSRIHLNAATELGGERVLLSHFPYRGGGDHTATERFTDWRLRNTGEWLLCAHVHQAWLVSGKQVNVGVDQWGMGPVPRSVLAQLIDLLDAGGTVVDAEAFRDRWVDETGGRVLTAATELYVPV